MEEGKKILGELNQIRKAGNIKDVSRVVAILLEYKGTDIAKTAAGLLADVKKKEIIDLMIGALQEKENTPIRKELIQICWESGLDYSDHLPYFVDLFLTADYEAAIEAFTLIENTYLDFTPPDESKPVLATKIKTVLVDLPEHTQNLAMELLHLLK